MSKMTQPQLHKVNNALLCAILLINGYLVLAPLLPRLFYSWHSHQGQQQRLTQALHSGGAAPTKPHANQLIVPRMALDSPIYDGPVRDQYQMLNKGIWRYANGSTPDKGSNTVLVGHRFTYTNPKGIFYYLNKVKPNDEIGLWWNNKKYLYKVTAVIVVPPTDTAIENPSAKPQLTLFTCTPLWLPKNRLVVVAQLETNQGDKQ